MVLVYIHTRSRRSEGTEPESAAEPEPTCQHHLPTRDTGNKRKRKRIGASQFHLRSRYRQDSVTGTDLGLFLALDLSPSTYLWRLPLAGAHRLLLAPSAEKDNFPTTPRENTVRSSPHLNRVYNPLLLLTQQPRS